MQDVNAARKILENNHQIASEIIVRWYNDEHYFHMNPEIIYLENTDKLLKFIHREELLCRELAQSLPSTQSIMICLTVFSVLVNGDKYYTQGSLHMFAIEAVRILLYGASKEREYLPFSLNKLYVLLEHIKIMNESKELALMMSAGLLCDPEQLCIYYGKITVSKKDFQIMEYRRSHFTGRGTRLRIAKDTRKLLLDDLEQMNKHGSLNSEFLNSMKLLISTDISGQDIPFFNGTCYEYLPATNECDVTYKEFISIFLEKLDFLNSLEFGLAKLWDHLYFGRKQRLEYWSLVFNSAFIVPHNWVKEHFVFVPEWKRWNLSANYEVPLLKTPVIQTYNGSYATTFLLFADAMNSWVEDSIYRNHESTSWKEQFCHKIESSFENEVIAFMRMEGFIAGTVEQDGKWHIDKDCIENLHILLPGEVDVFAANHSKKISYLIECKCLHDVFTSSGNIHQKLKNINRKLSNKFPNILKGKRSIILQYLSEYFPDYKLVTVITTDVNFPVYLQNNNRLEWEDIISICDFNALKDAVLNETYPKTCVQHIN